MGVVHSHKELPQDRLATTDEQGYRLVVHPADVRGLFRRWRTVVHAVLLLVFLLLPWLKIHGQQALLLDVTHRRFNIFGLVLWAHDAPLFVFVLLGGALALLLVTAVWGRVWCGWACPQTVFIDAVFRRIERAVEGDAVQRRRLHGEPWSVDKALKKAAKWFLFTAAALIISHSFLAYFVGTEELAIIVRLSPYENWGTFLLMGSVTALILFDFGWFREQFCIIMCPYGRFQSVLMDELSMVIAYDEARGEPRRGSTVGDGVKVGDCISCARCVQVCPTGIDIRRGTQMECIACTACIDACDEIMQKVGKPRGLIDYRHANRLPTARGWVYATLLLALMLGLSFALATREPLSISVLRAKESPYSSVDAQTVANHFRFHLKNQGDRPLAITIESADAAVSVVSAMPVIHLAPGESVMQDVFLRFPVSILKSGHGRVHILFRDAASQERRWTEVGLVGPFT